MKIIYSQWSLTESIEKNQPYANFKDFESFLWSWVLSVHSAKQHTENIVLYCDTFTKKILVDELNLPFASVQENLNDIKNYNRIWAYSKLKTYSIQSEPFLHIDGDVYLLEDKIICDESFGVFSLEEVDSTQVGYARGYRNLMKCPVIPEILKQSPIVYNVKRHAPNLGMLFVNNTNNSCYKEYIEIINKFIEENIYFINNNLTFNQTYWLSIILEQYLLGLLFDKYQVKYDLLSLKQDRVNRNMHLIGDSKLYYSDHIKNQALFFTGNLYVNKIQDITNKYTHE